MHELGLRVQYKVLYMRESSISITFLSYKFWNDCRKKLVETGNDQGSLNNPPPPSVLLT